VGVVSYGGGDVGLAGQTQDVERDVAERGHDLGSVTSADLGAVLVPGHITDVEDDSRYATRVGPSRAGQRVGPARRAGTRSGRRFPTGFTGDIPGAGDPHGLGGVGKAQATGGGDGDGFESAGLPAAVPAVAGAVSDTDLCPGQSGAVALRDRWPGQDGAMKLSSRRRATPTPTPDSAFTGFRFPAEVIVLAVRWYLRYGLSYRDVEDLLFERGVEVDHVTVYRWVQRFTPLLADAARFARHSPGDRWFVDETYVKVNGVWRYVYRAVDQDGQVIDVLVSARRDSDAARRFLRRALTTLKVTPIEVVTDAAAVYPRVLDELVSAAWHHVERWANNRIEADHSQLKHRLRPMRGLRTDRTATVIIAGLAFLQNLRRGHYELAVDLPAPLRVAAAFTELARAI
jgi:transposase-like protein